jgi:hypothetical protein
MTSKVFHIKRKINVVAHHCTHQAKFHSRTRPTRSCGNSAHRNVYQILSSLLYDAFELNENCRVLCTLHGSKKK